MLVWKKTYEKVVNDNKRLQKEITLLYRKLNTMRNAGKK